MTAVTSSKEDLVEKTITLNNYSLVHLEKLLYMLTKRFGGLTIEGCDVDIACQVITHIFEGHGE